jgi:hypothetical protein
VRATWSDSLNSLDLITPTSVEGYEPRALHYTVLSMLLLLPALNCALFIDFHSPCSSLRPVTTLSQVCRCVRLRVGIHVTKLLWSNCEMLRGLDSSVSTATCYGLDGPGIESLWRRDFPHPSRPALGPTQPLYNGYRVFPGAKAARAWR